MEALADYDERPPLGVVRRRSPPLLIVVFFVRTSGANAECVSFRRDEVEAGVVCRYP
eukprot:CAMPEP_0181101238 /NCGR_PEP_ID=MMETSP1071-20121207/13642_1 /TAXON_ID=35127 /ORGANISM="Thalassiosira sp., Strain NH16" /LENGTH=56 /DNA_ID=CAMNT_0023184065 /DNA_START=1 /DNA_END=171 /DNA_ORIENTATION=-